MTTREEPVISDLSLALFADKLREFIARREYESRLIERVAILHGLGIDLSSNDLSLITE